MVHTLSMMYKLFIFIFFILNLTNTIEAQRKIVCYYGSWAVYRPGAGKFNVEDINPNLCTHLIYSFAGVYNDGNIKVLDSWNDIDLQGYVRFNKLKLQNPNLKTLLAVGGWNEGSSKYSLIASNSQYRQNFVRSALNFLNDYKFDGLDLDWEYPAQRGGIPADKVNFITLLKELRNAFGSRYLLSVAVGATVAMVDTSYDVSSLSNIVDFINLMTYDLHGSWGGITGANAPLYSSQSNDLLTLSSCVSYWILKGAAPSKLILGIPIYGRTFTLKNINQNNVGASTSGPGTAGPYTGESGILGYNEIYDFIKTNQWVQKWDDVQKVPYIYRGNQWVSYDNERSVLIKTNYAKSQGLGGVMVWSIDTDPIRLDSVRNPIMNTIKQNI